ncbi:hypothetical protein Poli38472_007940 [Pythium oligandrum]|uniref:Acyl-CoA dehydrogenase n=1 Tax=Pythium oligandrum TaxID=41045 RepID=A0A8K1CLT3_PYTOL|nr:hypothetical protein Poli38472_007940 [Pythium oligandrum]|eukprot:TMW65298.1 hypothetical protein Poli38472_007940 [Pythium oligandrum]
MVVQNVRTALDAPALEKYIHAALGDFHGPLAEIAQFQHGQSNPTYLLTMATSHAKWVLRKKPHGKILPSAHAVEREYRVLKALQYTEVPLPKPILLCEDSSVIGTPFYLMEYVEGRIFEDPALPGVRPLHRYAMYSAVCDALAKLHAVDIKEVGLEDFGRSDHYSQRVVARWTKQVEAGSPVFKKAGVAENPQMDKLRQWLQANADAAEAETAGRPVLVHGDFRIDNVIFHPTEPRVLAILDWELCTVGNGFADVATLACTYRIPSDMGDIKMKIPGLKGLKKSFEDLGIPSEYEFLTGYCRRAKRFPLKPETWTFFLGVVFFRFAAIAHGVYARSLQGNASSAHAHDAKRAMDAILSYSNELTGTSAKSIYPEPKLDHILPFPIRPHALEMYKTMLKFCEERVFPAEHLHFKEIADARAKGREWKDTPEITEVLKAEARELGLWNLFLPQGTIPASEGNPAYKYGSDLTNLEYGLMCEITGRSILLAPEVFNCAAPDTGNMEVLHRFGTPKQNHKWLKPLLEGEIRSCFAMTEKLVASSDATNIETEFVRDERTGEYVINGHKFYISGAGDPRCKIAIVMGKVVDKRHIGKKTDPFRQQSMILVPMDTPGVEVIRPMEVFGYDDAPHGHMEMVFKDVRVPFENIIFGEGRGFEIAQARLGPGRIHHCMRAIGVAERSLELMVKRAKTRTAFRQLLAENHLVRSQIAESRLELDSARLLTLQAAHQMDTKGNKVAQQSIAMIKIAAPRVALKVIDRAIQIHGAAGVSQDFVLAYLYAGMRTLRLADGPDEVHMRTIAKLELTHCRL